jgi:hypothetical protein
MITVVPIYNKYLSLEELEKSDFYKKYAPNGWPYKLAIRSSVGWCPWTLLVAEDGSAKVWLSPSEGVVGDSVLDLPKSVVNGEKK